MEIFLTVLAIIGLYAAYEIMLHNKIKKENERNNKKRSKKRYKKRKKTTGSAKVSKVSTQNKRKPGRPKKQIKR